MLKDVWHIESIALVKSCLPMKIWETTKPQVISTNIDFLISKPKTSGKLSSPYGNNWWKGGRLIVCFSYDQFCGLLRTMFPELGSGIAAGWGPASHEDLVVLFLDSDFEIIRIRNGIKYICI